MRYVAMSRHSYADSHCQHAIPGAGLIKLELYREPIAGPGRAYVALFLRSWSKISFAARAPSEAPPSIKPGSRPSSARQRSAPPRLLVAGERGVIGPLSRGELDALRLGSKRRAGVLFGGSARKDCLEAVEESCEEPSRPLGALGDGARIPSCWGRWHKLVFAAVRLCDSMNSGA
jgi:hypothetical protein